MSSLPAASIRPDEQRREKLVVAALLQKWLVGHVKQEVLPE